jgi:glycopeptide antibiotics resistance protein
MSAESATDARPHGPPSRGARAEPRIDARIVLLTRLAYVGILVLATLSPFDFDARLGEAAGRLARAFHPTYAPRDAVDAVRNVVLFAGWGALWVVTAARSTLWRTALPALLTGLVMSAGIELTQSMMPARTSSALDVASNTVGALFGAVVIVGIVTALRARRGGKSYVGIPGLLFLGGYLAAVAFEAVFAPFRLEPPPGVYGGPLVRMHATLAQFSWGSVLTIPLGDLPLFLPVGAFGVAALVELGWPYANAARLTVVMGTLLWIASELSHGPLALPIQAGAVLGHTAALAAGAWLAVRFLPPFSRRVRGRWRPLGLAAVYVCVLLLWSWRPFHLETDPAALRAQLSLDRLVPLQASAVRPDLFSVADLAEGFLLYLPLGGLLGVWPVRRTGWLRGLLPGIYVAAAAEVGQILVVGRFFDVTDFLVQAAGVAVGWAVAHHAGYQPYGSMLPATRSAKPAGFHQDT